MAGDHGRGQNLQKIFNFILNKWGIIVFILQMKQRINESSPLCQKHPRILSVGCTLHVPTAVSCLLHRGGMQMEGMMFVFGVSILSLLPFSNLLSIPCLFDTPH